MGCCFKVRVSDSGFEAQGSKSRVWVLLYRLLATGVSGRVSC